MARYGLFGLLSIALTVSAVVVLSGGGSGSGAAPAVPEPSAVEAPSASPTIYGASTSNGAGGSETALHGLGAVAHRFVSAFLEYEVGDRSRQVVAALRSTSTSPFLAELLRYPAGVAGARAPRRAKLSRVRLEKVSAAPPVALVSGEALRADGPEEFAFVFIGTGEGWRARGPGE